MSDKDFFRGSLNPIRAARSAIYDFRFMRDNPSFFYPCGIWLLCGAQGTGKTLSAVKTAKALLADYPAAVLCSNIVLRGFDRDIIPFTDPEQLMTLDNGTDGIVFLLDEIQVIFNSLESRNIPISIIGEFSQNRKSRRVILGTSQVYGRVAKPVREQCKYVIKCNSFLKYLQMNTIIDPNADGYTSEDDGHTEGKVIYKSFWFHAPEDYQSYDTYYKVKKPSKGVKK